MAALSPDLIGIITLFVVSLITLLVYYIGLSKMFIGKPDVVAPQVPESDQGQAKTGAEWRAAGYNLRAKTIYENGGLDVEIGVLRAKMLYKLFLTLLPILVGVSLAYAFTGVTEAGTNRISLNNILAKDFTGRGWAESKEYNRKFEYLQRRVWICVVACYAVFFLCLKVCDNFDDKIVGLLNRCSKRAPAHHYAVLVTDLEPSDSGETVKAFFETCLGEGAVRRVVDVPSLEGDVVPPQEGDEEPGLLKKVLLGASGPPASVRGAVQKWAECLGQQERAEALDADPEERLKRQESAVKKDPEAQLSDVQDAKEATADARRRAELAREHAAAGEDETGKKSEVEAPPKAIIVVFDSLSRASVALSAQLRNAGVEDGWTVQPMPEPRDLRWAAVETLPDRATRDKKSKTAFTIKLYILMFWSVVLAGISIAIVRVAESAAKLDPALEGVAAAVVAWVGASLAATLLMAMAGILAVINDLLETHLTESSLQRQTSRDYAKFIIIAGFVFQLLGTSLYTSFTEAGGNPFQVIQFIAAQVPTNAYVILMTVMKIMFYPPNAACRLDDEITRRVLNKLFMVPTPVTDREKRIPVNPLLLFDACGLDTFVFVIGVTYAPMAPATTFACFIYFALGVIPRKLEPQVYESQFDTDGTWARIYANQTSWAILLALLINAAIVGFSGAYYAVLVMVPLLFVWFHYRHKFAKRHLNSVHGASNSRLALEDASGLDKERAADIEAFEADLFARGFWQAPEAVPESLAVDAEGPAKDQLDVLEGWLKRHHAKDAGSWSLGAAGGRHGDAEADADRFKAAAKQA